MKSLSAPFRIIIHRFCSLCNESWNTMALHSLLANLLFKKLYYNTVASHGCRNHVQWCATINLPNIGYPCLHIFLHSHNCTCLPWNVGKHYDCFLTLCWLADFKGCVLLLGIFEAATVCMSVRDAAKDLKRFGSWWQVFCSTSIP